MKHYKAVFSLLVLLPIAVYAGNTTVEGSENVAGNTAGHDIKINKTVVNNYGVTQKTKDNNVTINIHIDRLKGISIPLQQEDLNETSESKPKSQLIPINNNSSNNDKLLYAKSLHDLAESYRMQDRYFDAEKYYLESLEIYERELGKNHVEVAKILNNLALLYDAQRRFSESEPLHLRSIKILKEKLGEQHSAVAIGINNLAVLYTKQGKYSKAEKLYLSSAEIFKSELGKNNINFVNTSNNLAMMCRQKKDENHDVAAIAGSNFVLLDCLFLGCAHIPIPSSAVGVEGCSIETGHLGENASESSSDEFIDEQTDNKQSKEKIAAVYANLGIVYKLKGNKAEAKRYYQKAIELFKYIGSPNAEKIQNLLNDLK